MKTMRIVLPLVCFFPLLLSAQVTYRNTTTEKALKQYKQGEEHDRRQEFALAQGYYEKSVQLDPFFVDAWMALGDVETQLKHWNAAELAFEKAIILDPAYASIGFVLAAQMEWAQEKFAEASAHAQAYIKRTASNDALYGVAVNLDKNARFALHAVDNPVPFKPINLGPGVNTANGEYFPALTADGETLVFTRRLPAGIMDQEDFFQSTLVDSLWQHAIPIAAINTPDNEGAQAISPDGTWLVFTACNRRGDGSQGSCDLYWSQLKREGWSNPVPFSNAINSEHFDSQPSISADGQSIAFVSKRPGGKGKADIWIAERGEKGKWNPPYNLGATVNTGGMEMAPYLHPDGQTLYFASDSLPGMGGLDLYVTRRGANGQWTTPQNLGYPINTTGDEVALTVSLDGKTAYYATNRPEGYGEMDIYAFELPESVRPLPATYAKIKVVDAETGQLLSARAEIVDLTDNRMYASAVTRKDGTALICLPVGQEYMLNVNRPGYLFYSDNFNLVDKKTIAEPFTITAKLMPLPSENQTGAVGKPIVLRNVFFDTGSAELKPESFNELNRLVTLLQEMPSIRIQINGHTDNVGDDNSNQALSENRAKSVYHYLIAKGIKDDRLRYQGFGESQPLVENNTDGQRAKNRRTEFIIL
jgi:outer membrane protein OmpA-like peptidoglycan-associated protein/Tol biopolymer transport system component